MSEIVVQTFLTLDGVAQAPGEKNEDPEGGFEHGGWQGASGIDQLIADWESRTEALLLGRKTYDIWLNAWAVWPEDAPGQMGELTRTYNRVPKYVATRTLTELSWKNSHVVDDVPATVAALRAESGGEIRVWGSLNLIRTLAEHDLVDEYRLVQYPLVLGSGKKLFSDGFPTTNLALQQSWSVESGVVVSIYRRGDHRE